jgi:hypothetical protein
MKWRLFTAHPGTRRHIADFSYLFHQESAMSEKISAKFRFAHQLTAVAAITASLACSVAFASGSMSPGGGQGADAYNVGKSVFFKQIACDTCAYAGRGKDAADAKALLATLKSPESKAKIDADEFGAVEAYLTKRFRLTDMAGK